MELARNLPIGQAVTVSENVLGAPLLQLCFGLDPLLLLGLPLVVFGLCRAGVLGWWTLASVVAGTVLLPFSPASGNLVPAVAFALIQLPLAVAGVRLDRPGPAARLSNLSATPSLLLCGRGGVVVLSRAATPSGGRRARGSARGAPTGRPAGRCW